MSVIFVFGLPLQVNGKPYNQARLLLGSIGSLHPANRLAGYITGRLQVPTSISQMASRQRGATDKINSRDELRIEVAGTVTPPTVTAVKSADLKAPTQSPGEHTSSICFANAGHNQLKNAPKPNHPPLSPVRTELLEFHSGPTFSVL